MVNGWDQYLTGINGFVNRSGITKGGIYSHNGLIFAEKSLHENQQNIQIINNFFSDASSGYTKGFQLDNQKFTILRVDNSDGLIQARSKVDSRSCTIVRTNQTIVIAVGEPDSIGAAISVTVGKVTDYFRRKGF